MYNVFVDSMLDWGEYGSADTLLHVLNALRQQCAHVLPFALYPLLIFFAFNQLPSLQVFKICLISISNIDKP